MQPNEILEVENSNPRQKPEPVASWAHQVGFLLIMASRSLRRGPSAAIRRAL
jgi:hypothetical protein